LGWVRWPGALMLTVVMALITWAIVTRLHRRITAASAQQK
jgi:protein-S-isoprenylcysteine O-methyltransferase Ste14